jgi:hypothetical protein
MIGPIAQRANHRFEFGSDATVGLATVLQNRGRAGRRLNYLFEEGNRYAAAALTRQLVEVEYLGGISETRHAALGAGSPGRLDRGYPAVF